jgi:hypothetical protein
VTLHLQLGVLLAFASAMAANFGFFYKYRGVQDTPRVPLSRPLRAVTILFTSPWFVLGVLVAIVGWALHVAALWVAPMSVVQAALAVGVVFIAVLADRMFGFTVGRRQWCGLLLAAGGLLLLGATLPTVHGTHAAFHGPTMVAFELVAGAAALALMLAATFGAGSVGQQGVMLGASAGLLWGVSDTAIKALTGIAEASGAGGVLASPLLAVSIVASFVALFASARGLQLGEAVPVIAVTGTGANVAGILGGVIVFGDPVAGGPLGVAAQALAFGLVVLAAFILPAPVRSAHVVEPA